MVIIRLDNDVNYQSGGYKLGVEGTKSSDFFELLLNEYPEDKVQFRGGQVWIKAVVVWDNKILGNRPDYRWINVAHIVQVEDNA